MSGIAIDETPTNVNDDIDILNGVDPESAGDEEVLEESEEIAEESEEIPEEEETLEEDDEEEEVEDDEVEEVEEESEEDPTKDLDLYNKLKTKFPKILKQVPELRATIFREKAFREIFPTLDDAKIAVDSITTLGRAQSTIAAADVNGLFDLIGTEPLKKMAPSLLASLYKVDKEAHYDAILPTLEGVVRQFYNFGVTNKDANAQNAAMHLSQFLFSDARVAKGEITTIKKQAEVSPEVKQQQEREEALNQREFNIFRNPIVSEASAKLESLILEKDNNGKLKMDPDGVLSKYISGILVGKISDEVHAQMKADKAYMAKINSLWEGAKKAKYQGDWDRQIKSAFLTRAKTLVPAIRSRLVGEALGTSKKNSEQKLKTIEKSSSRKSVSGGKSNGNHSPSSKVDWTKTSDLDFLSGNVKFK